MYLSQSNFPQNLQNQMISQYINSEPENLILRELVYLNVAIF